MAKAECITCMWEAATGRTVDTSMSKVAWASEVGVKESSIRRHLSHSKVAQTGAQGVPEPTVRRGEFVISKDDLLKQWGIPEATVTARGASIRDPETGSWQTVKWNPNEGTDGPAWPVVQPAATVEVRPAEAAFAPASNGYRVALKCADTQIGYRMQSDGTLEPFHDAKAMDLFVEICRVYQPDKISILGDFLDFASFGRFAQEASFANTTQLSFNYAHEWLARLRSAAPGASMVLIEGNHDVRMQNFVEANALAAFGLKQANLPDSWPVMSVPYLLRLEELGIEYVDAYPAATDWDNARTRNIHGTRVNSKGSTMSQYVHELPHVNTWAGHTHRAEVIYRTVLGEYGSPIESYAANPGVLCRTDGAVPSVHGAINGSGKAATIVEDWQQGFGLLFYNETESIPQVYRIFNGSTIIDGKVLSVG